ncbi:hypothetical protein AU210_016376 [Fusarium oxysporum f. sp. radicis-cucumerinum]|uniref:Uncharacterized protein n=1 Tax=Fusarium oxysporum f. sp. radicis-cucumerinum TaxID=327505 RepID=A0A2H3GAN7_FUSOX|nr:hypothetical protein AU210_016376 [Fusarium oxysporum f. sp. radicis-cucumerinum]
MALIKSSCVKDNLIAGLQRRLTHDDLDESCYTYRGLPLEDIFLMDENEYKHHLPLLKAILEGFNATNQFAIIRPHQHIPVQPGSHMVWNSGKHKQLRYYYGKTATNRGTHLDQLCGRKFVVVGGKLLPVEYCLSPLPDLREVGLALYDTFTDYVSKHHLESIFGLEYIITGLSKKKWAEHVFPDYGYMILVDLPLPSSDEAEEVVTGWSWRSETEALSGETHVCVKPLNTAKHERRPILRKGTTPSIDDVVCALMNCGAHDGGEGTL